MENRFITPTVRSLTSEQLVFEHELGEGGFGCVIQAQLDGQDVAVKQLLHPNKNAFAQFQLELHHLARAQDSEYIIKLVGAVYYRFKGDDQQGNALIKKTNPQLIRSNKLKEIYSDTTIKNYILNR